METFILFSLSEKGSRGKIALRSLCSDPNQVILSTGLQKKRRSVKKDEWRKQAAGVSLVPPEKRPRTKDDDEDEENCQTL
jgi:hypothetical protein